MFIARYASNGDQRWVRQFGFSDYQYTYAAAQDGSGGAYIVGYTGTNASGGFDGLLSRYAADGERLWVRQVGGADADYAYGASPDGSGGVFVVGTTTGSFPGPSAGGNDAWVARYGPDGAFFWVRQLGTSSYEVAYAAATDGNGGVYVVGETSGALGGLPAGVEDAWLARYDAAGQFLWVRQFGTGADDRAYSVSPAPGGGAFLGGITRGSLGAPNAGTFDAWIARYSSDGERHWVRQFGTPAADALNSVVPGEGTSLFAAGTTYGSLGSTNGGGVDAWIARWTVQPACYPNCDDSTAPPVLNPADFTCFIQRFAAADPYTNCDNSTASPVINVQDFTCFLQRYAAGCN